MSFFLGKDLCRISSMYILSDKRGKTAASVFWRLCSSFLFTVQWSIHKKFNWGNRIVIVRRPFSYYNKYHAKESVVIKMKSCCAVIVAAGSSSRMGGDRSKQFLPLLGEPAIAYTLAAFERAESITAMIVAARPEDFEELQKIIQEKGFGKVKGIVSGGKSRQESVAAGVAQAGEFDYFAIHDGARPLVLPEEIDRVVQDAFQFRASALAVPVKDTIKIVDQNGMVLATPDRSLLWAVQTPQVFESSLYRQAMHLAYEQGKDYTDDCQLVEAAGEGVHLCMGSYSNLKLTTQDDIPAAEAVLKGRKQR